MPLSAGDKLGPYEILSLLGAGGMGEVYRARDTRLSRDVAIKTLSSGLAEDTARMARFRREAQVLASLNHPNIAAIYGVEKNAIVMELVEGADLKGPVPVITAIAYARQIAIALEGAHDKGIIHRDLKPANIKVTPEGTVKILDFGIAKATEVPATDASPTISPTLSLTMTEKGMIMGTAAYMSPEQARGQAVDKRADIWAFGVILYELLTGKILFGGSKNVPDSLVAVLTREPDFGTLPKSTPPNVRRLLKHCLQKDPKQRLRDIGDARIVLDESESVAPMPPAPRRRWVWPLGMAALVMAVVIGSYRWPMEHPSGPFQHMRITPLTDSGKAAAAAISPDGKYVVHAITDEGQSSLWLLHVATGSNVQILPPTQGGFDNLNFSRDGNSFYYMLYKQEAPPTMYTMAVLGGNARALAAFSALRTTAPGANGIAISPDEKGVTFPRVSAVDDGLFVRNLDGGPERKLAARKLPDQFLSPAWSPDGKTIAYGAYTGSGPSSAIGAIPVEGGPERRISSRLGARIRAMHWMPDGNGLIAAANLRYPLYQLWYIGYPGGQARSITNDLNSYSGLSLTGNGGALVTIQNETISHLWVVSPGDLRTAREISTGRLDGLNGVNFAGDGDLYFEAPDSSGATQIWSTAPDGTARRQITSGTDNTGEPALCGDSRHMLFASFRAGSSHIFVSDLDGGNVRQLTNGGYEASPSCSPDGTWLTYKSTDSRNAGVWRMQMDGGSSSIRIWDQPVYSEISPDGKSVLVAGTDGKVTILPATGGQPVRGFDGVPSLGLFGIVSWSADGAALLYGQTVGSVTNIWRRPLDGREPAQVTTFTSERITAFAVSRDGKRLALARGTNRSDVVLIKDVR